MIHSVEELEPKRRDLPSEPTGPKPDEKVLNLLRIMSHDIRGSFVSISSTLKLLNRGYYGKMDDGVATALEELLSKTIGLTRMTEEYLGRILPTNEGSETEGEAMDLVQDVITPVLEEFSSELKDHPFQIDNSLARGSNGRISIKSGGIWLKAVKKSSQERHQLWWKKVRSSLLRIRIWDSMFNSGSRPRGMAGQTILKKIGRLEGGLKGLSLGLCQSRD
jgi:hypothetical protein